MTALAVVFLVIYILAVFGGGALTYAPNDYKHFGSYLLVMILIGILGWKVFNP